ncbi:lipase family protein [Chelativorans salis]|uniref:Lipase family protein n=1 Tax=Chelativorans salis TaxID=2978478 RepID=A0ABT2LLJ5_9HYPH|nr:lipase family protein [Chelativorans sp. EGI FJ00035]MCT7375302.1 lipase family protein [Chelativorans sp. EGI FJ00035]
MRRIVNVRTGPLLGLYLAAFMLLTGGCAIEPGTPGPFYQVERSALAGAPGNIIRSEVFAGAPTGARAWRVVYRSTGLDGEPIAVSGVIVAPERPSDAPQKVVAWAHGTTGIVSRCAPSLRRGFFGSVPGLKAFLDRGYVVVATDYPGLGTPSPHPYLVGTSEGRAVLDSVRAAMRMPEVEASNEFAVWGHSQGGHAALYTGQLAASYAPDLKLAGVAAAAPATDLTQLLRDDIDSAPGRVLTAYALWSWNRVYGAPLDNLLDPSTGAAVDRIAEDCLEGLFQALLLRRHEKALEKDFIHGDLSDIEPWRSLLVNNSAGSAATGAPLFIAQGSADMLVRPRVTISYAHSACRAGTPVSFDWIEGGDHLAAATKGADKAADWIAGRLEGAAAPSDCDKLPTVAAPG